MKKTLLLLAFCLCLSALSLRSYWSAAFPTKTPWVAPGSEGWEVDGMQVFSVQPSGRELDSGEILRGGDFLTWPSGLVTQLGGNDWRIGWPASVWIEPGAKVYR